MSEVEREGNASGTERGRSPSGVPDAGAGRAGETRAAWGGVPLGRVQAGAPEVGDVAGGPEPEGPVGPPRLRGAGKGRKLVKRPEAGPAGPVALTPEQRLLLLDTWKRSGLPAGD